IRDFHVTGVQTCALPISGYYSLAVARDWHVLFAWIFALSLLLFMLAALANGHFRRDLGTRWRDWHPRAVWADIRAHLRFDFAPQIGRASCRERVQTSQAA